VLKKRLGDDSQRCDPKTVVSGMRQAKYR